MCDLADKEYATDTVSVREEIPNIYSNIKFCNYLLWHYK